MKFLKPVACVFLLNLIISCEPYVCCMPPQPYELIESVKEGSQFGVAVGDSQEKAYEDFQKYAQENKIVELNLDANFFTNLDQIEHSYQNYSRIELVLSKPQQLLVITIKDGVIDSLIYNNNFSATWPTNASNPFKINDPVESLFEKMKSNLQNLDYINLSKRFIEKPYDKLLENSMYWRFENDKTKSQGFYYVLYFQDKKLTQINTYKWL